MSLVKAPPRDEAPPHSREAERCVLGSCLLLPDLLSQLELQSSDFYSEGNARIWSAMQYVHAEGQPVDQLTVRERLVELGQLSVVGGDDYLLGLGDTIATPDNAQAHASIVLKLSRQRGVQALGRRLSKAAQDGDLADAQTAVRAAAQVLEQAEKRPVVEWRSAFEVFAPLPPVSWRVRGLQLCPGRPGAFVGYGASAKTLSAQALALACAAGRPVWNYFDAPQMRVLHFDYEQGWHATAWRYQRLAAGHRIDPREVAEHLRVTVFPGVYLDQPDAVDAYAKLCEGSELAILDSLKAMTPTRDENDNSIRTCVDVLTRVSERTGCAFILLHHAGKTDPGSRDARQHGRGASAIFDACGSWFNFFAGKDKDDPRAVSQAKPPAEAAGRGVEDFLLDVQDVAVPGLPEGGVRVVHRSTAKPDPVATSSARYDAMTHQVLAVIERHPGSIGNEIVGRLGAGRTTVFTILQSLEQRRVIRSTPGPRNTNHYYLAGQHGSPEDDD